MKRQRTAFIGLLVRSICFSHQNSSYYLTLWNQDVMNQEDGATMTDLIGRALAKGVTQYRELEFQLNSEKGLFQTSHLKTPLTREIFS